MPRINLDKVPLRTGSGYPEPFKSRMQGRSSLRLGDAGGLTQFGANMIILAPGAMSSVRHWHHKEDEFVMVTQGECVLIDDSGETVMRAGDCAAFPASDGNGHHLINRSAVEARFLVIGTRIEGERAEYPDDDLAVQTVDGKHIFTHKDGTAYGGDND